MEEQIQINEKTDSEWEVAGSGTAEPAENGDSPNVLKEWQLSLARKQDELNLLEIQLLKQQAELEAQKRNARNSLQLELDRMRMEAEERIAREQNAFEAKRREQVEDLEKELWEKRETAGKEEERERFAALKKLEEEKLSLKQFEEASDEFKRSRNEKNTVLTLEEINDGYIKKCNMVSKTQDKLAQKTNEFAGQVLWNFLNPNNK